MMLYSVYTLHNKKITVIFGKEGMIKSVLQNRGSHKLLKNAICHLSFSANLQKNVSEIGTIVTSKPLIQIQNPLLKPTSTESIPTIRELSDIIRIHAAKVYNGPRMNFDSSWVHDQTIGTQHAIIPLATQPHQYLFTCSENKKAFVLGVIFEEADILATYIGYKHNQSPEVAIGTPAHHTIGIVTGCIDRIGIDVIQTKMNDQHIDPNAEFREDQDILLTGFVSWLGKSSMEVIITARQKDESAPTGFRDLLISKFIMVSVTPEFKSAPNVPLQLSTEEEKRMFDEGEKAKNDRVKRDKTSIVAIGPTVEEYKLLRKLANKTMDPMLVLF